MNIDSVKRRKNNLSIDAVDAETLMDKLPMDSDIPVNNLGIHSDNISIAVLLVLYTLQGIPMGLSASIPLLLSE